MASSRKPPSDDGGRGSTAVARAAVARSLDRALASAQLRGKRVAVGLSGGVDSVVLLHLLKERALAGGFSLSAVHVHHGLSSNADEWMAHCRSICRASSVPLKVFRVKVRRQGQGIEAAAREARYAAFRKTAGDVIALAHQLDDQAETVLMNLLRGAGLRGASGMAPTARLEGKVLFRPLLDVPREEIVRHAEKHGLRWIDDESNRDESLTRNFIRRRVGALIGQRFPRWRESLARAARHFAERDASAGRALREFLAAQGLRAPTEKNLIEMLRQLSGTGARIEVRHDGARFRVYRGEVRRLEKKATYAFSGKPWRGERLLALEELGGELRFRRARGRGFSIPNSEAIEVRLRAGGEKLQPDARRPRRTLKNLFQEAGVPAWERERLPLLFCGDDLVWAPGLGVDARYQVGPKALGWLAEWHQSPV